VARKEKKAGPEVRLQGLFEAGDWGAAWGEARQLKASSAEAETAARDVEQRMRPDPSAVWAAAAGALLLAVVAAVGLFGR